MSVPAAGRVGGLLNRRPVRLATDVAAAGIFVGFLFVLFPALLQHTDPRRDVMHVFVHVQRIREGLPLYWPWPEAGPYLHATAPYPAERVSWPPILTPLASLLGGLSFTGFSRIWTVILSAAVVVYAGTLACISGRLTLRSFLLAFAAVLLCPGTIRTLALGNPDPLVWVGIGVGVAASGAARGAGFMSSALIKLFGVWPLLAAVLRREGGRVLLGAGLCAAVLGGAAMAILTPARFVASSIAYARDMLPALGQGTFAPENLSLSMAGLRLARSFGWHYAGGPLPEPARLFLFAVGVTGPAVTIWILRRRSPGLQAAGVTCAAIAFGPICWTTYLPIGLALVAVGIRERPSVAYVTTGLVVEGQALSQADDRAARPDARSVSP